MNNVKKFVLIAALAWAPLSVEAAQKIHFSGWATGFHRANLNGQNKVDTGIYAFDDSHFSPHTDSYFVPHMLYVAWGTAWDGWSISGLKRPTDTNGAISWEMKSDSPEITAIALRIGHELVYATASPREFRHISLFGTGDSPLFTVPGGGWVSDIAVVGSTLYWTDSNGIHRAGLDGTGHALITPGNFVGKGLDVNSTHIFYAGLNLDVLARMKLDGSELVALAYGGLNSFGYPRLDGLGRVYWVDMDNQTIKRANLNGGEIETIVSSALPLDPFNLSLEVGEYSCTRTEKYGDLVSPFFDGGANPLQPDFKDIAKTVACFLENCTELEYDRADVEPCWSLTQCAGNGTVDFKDIAQLVKLFQDFSPCP